MGGEGDRGVFRWEGIFFITVLYIIVAFLYLAFFGFIFLNKVSGKKVDICITRLGEG